MILLTSEVLRQLSTVSGFNSHLSPFQFCQKSAESTHLSRGDDVDWYTTISTSRNPRLRLWSCAAQSERDFCAFPFAPSLSLRLIRFRKY